MPTVASPPSTIASTTPTASSHEPSTVVRTPRVTAPPAHSVPLTTARSTGTRSALAASCGPGLRPATNHSTVRRWRNPAHTVPTAKESST